MSQPSASLSVMSTPPRRRRHHDCLITPAREQANTTKFHTKKSADIRFSEVVPKGQLTLDKCLWDRASGSGARGRSDRVIPGVTSRPPALRPDADYRGTPTIHMFKNTFSITERWVRRLAVQYTAFCFIRFWTPRPCSGLFWYIVLDCVMFCSVSFFSMVFCVFLCGFVVFYSLSFIYSFLRFFLLEQRKPNTPLPLDRGSCILESNPCIPAYLTSCIALQCHSLVALPVSATSFFQTTHVVWGPCRLGYCSPG